MSMFQYCAASVRSVAGVRSERERSERSTSLTGYFSCLGDFTAILTAFAALLPCCPAALLPCCPAALLPCWLWWLWLLWRLADFDDFDVTCSSSPQCCDATLLSSSSKLCPCQSLSLHWCRDLLIESTNLRCHFAVVVVPTLSLYRDRSISSIYIYIYIHTYI